MIKVRKKGMFFRKEVSTPYFLFSYLSGNCLAFPLMKERGNHVLESSDTDTLTINLKRFTFPQ